MNHMRLCGFAFGALIGFGLTNACMVSDTYTIRYYQLDEGQRVKRVVLAASFAPGVGETIEPAVLEMYQGVVREFVSHHHEYILLDARILPRDVFAANLPGATAIPRPPLALTPPIQGLCAADYDGRKTHSVLLNHFYKLERQGGSAALRVEARLIDCATGLLVWRALGENSYASEDSDLEQTIRGYTNRYGESVRPYVAGAYLLVRKLYDSMPDPTLNEDDIVEKIEVDALAE